VTLEPGGQFELSGAPVSTLHETCAEVNQHLQQVWAAIVPSAQSTSAACLLDIRAAISGQLALLPKCHQSRFWATCSQ
jgi:Glutamate-cysteine ligase family 2(GCS2)